MLALAPVRVVLVHWYSTVVGGMAYVQQSTQGLRRRPAQALLYVQVHSVLVPLARFTPTIANVIVPMVVPKVQLYAVIASKCQRFVDTNTDYQTPTVSRIVFRDRLGQEKNRILMRNKPLHIVARHRKPRELVSKHSPPCDLLDDESTSTGTVFDLFSLSILYQ